MNATPFTNNDASSPGGDNSNSDAFNRFTSELYTPGNSEMMNIRQSSGTPAGLPNVEFFAAGAADQNMPGEIQTQGDSVPEGDLEKAVAAVATDAKDGTIDDLEQLRQVLNTYGAGESETFVDDLNTQLSDSGVTAVPMDNRCGPMECGGGIEFEKDGTVTDRVSFEFDNGETITPEKIDHNFG